MCQLGRFRHENVLYNEQLKLAQGVLHKQVVRVGVGNVGADHVHAAHFAFFDRVKHFRVGHPLVGWHFHTPGIGDFLLLLGIVGRLVVGVDVGQRSHVARTLHVVLAAQRIDACAGSADVPS